MNKYIVLKNIQSYNCYLIKCNILFLLFKYLNNNFFYIIVNTLLIKRKLNTEHNIVDQYNCYNYYKHNSINY